ncbi:MAG: universal stress protein [Desulfobacteraceae bacterium]|jgi:nucleotide-binding universal stress UspA family protein|nr:universal stress protein [Desulfobacteraceae bacterium]
MEKILAGMNPASASYWAGLHALSLAKRIDAQVCFLYVSKSGSTGNPSRWTDREAASDFRARVDHLVEQAREEGISVQYYVSEGNYEGELVRFVHDKKITILVLGAPDGHGTGIARFGNFVDRIRHRVDCRIEVVHEKAFTGNPKRKEKIDVAHVSTHRRQ